MFYLKKYQILLTYAKNNQIQNFKLHVDLFLGNFFIAKKCTAWAYYFAGNSNFCQNWLQMGITYNIYKDEISCKDFFRCSCPLFHGITQLPDVKELLVQNRHHIWSFRHNNRIQTHNHLVCKRKLNHLAKQAKWFEFCCCHSRFVFPACRLIKNT